MTSAEAVAFVTSQQWFKEASSAWRAAEAERAKREREATVYVSCKNTWARRHYGTYWGKP